MSNNKITSKEGTLANDQLTEDMTLRAKHREEEDQQFVSVIVKRNDDSIRHPDDILEKVIEEGEEQHKRPVLSLFLSAVAAGLILGFAAMCVSIASELFPVSEYGVLGNRLAMAVVYPLGFIVCVMSGTQLFTEHTATAVYPVLDRKASLISLIRLWTVVLVGNFVGTFLSSQLIGMADNIILSGEGFVTIADHLIHNSGSDIFLSAILAGWLMAQGGWLIMATPPASSQILCIYIVTFIIGIGGLHHSIAGSAEIFGGLFFSDSPNFIGSLNFLFFAVLGNLVGGSFFVAILNYGFVKKTQ